MILGFEYSTKVWFRPSIGRHNLLLRCLPAVLPCQQIGYEEFSITDGFWHKESTDVWGNRIVAAGCLERHEILSYSCKGEVRNSTYCIPEKTPNILYSMASALVATNEEMRMLLPRLTGNFLVDCVNISHAVHQFVVYTPGVTNVLTRAEDVCRLRQGVCQDYAHLMIALCRAAGYPARYVCGLMVGEGSTHAWVEVYDGQCWYAFDPTNDTAIAFGYIKLAHGRDALDCSVGRGVYIGESAETTQIQVKVWNIENG